MEEFLDITPDELDQRMQSTEGDPEGIVDEPLNKEIIEIFSCRILTLRPSRPFRSSRFASSVAADIKI
jgi:hypothetical protein